MASVIKLLRSGRATFVGHLPKLANSAWATAEYLWYPLIAIATTPFMLKGLGVEQYGLWMLFTATVTFGGVLNIGTGAATIKQVSTALGQSRPELVEKVLQGSLAIALVGGGTLALVTTSIFWFASDSFFDKMGDAQTVFITGVAAGLIAWVGQIDNVCASVLKGSERFGQAARVEMAAKIGQMLAAVITVLLGGGLLAVYVTFGLATLVRLVAKLMIVTNTFQVASLRPNFREAFKTLEYSKWGWLQGVGGLTFGLADRFIVGSLLGATSLAYYSVAMQLASPIHAVTSAALSTVFPIVSRRQSREGGEPSLRRIAFLTFTVNFIICTVPAGMLLMFGDSILALWLGEKYAVATKEILWYLTIAFWLLALNITPYNILLGMGKMKSVSVIVMVSGGIGMLPIYFGSLWYGLIGATFGKIVFSTLALALFYPLYKEIYRR